MPHLWRRPRHSIDSVNSKKISFYISDSEVTPGALEVWSDLPEEIRNDPSLAPFRNQYEKQHGILTANNTTGSTDTQLDITIDDQQPTLSGTNGDVRHRSSKAEGQSTFNSASQGGIFSGGKVSFIHANIVGESAGSLNQPSNKPGPAPSSQAHDVSGQDDTDAVTGHKKTKPWMKTVKMVVLLACWILFTTILMTKNEKIYKTRQLSIPVNRTKSFLILEMPTEQKISIQLSGPFLPEQYGNLTAGWLTVWLELVHTDWSVSSDNVSSLQTEDVIFQKNLSEVWRIPLVPENMVDFVPEISKRRSFSVDLPPVITEPQNPTTIQPQSLNIPTVRPQMPNPEQLQAHNPTTAQQQAHNPTTAQQQAHNPTTAQQQAHNSTADQQQSYILNTGHLQSHNINSDQSNSTTIYQGLHSATDKIIIQNPVLHQIEISNTSSFHLEAENITSVPFDSPNLRAFLPHSSYIPLESPHRLLRLQISSSLAVITPVQLSYDVTPIDVRDGILYAAAVLVGLYVLVVFEIVHRTFAAILASTMSVAILAVLEKRPSTSELISWIDVETLLLLFSMMVLVAIMSETGLFDYLAVYAYKITGGKVWPLINYLCFFTAIMSSFLDNVTTVLLMTPVTIRLCEVMELNPVPILMAMIIYSNVGGTLTPVGDPPNVIIASNQNIVEAGIDFTTFTLHMSIGIVLVAIQTYIHLRIYFRNMSSLRHSEPQQVQDIRHEIAIWQRAAASLSSYSKDEDLVREALMKKVNRLMGQLKRRLKEGSSPAHYRDNLQQLTDKYPIRNRVLLVKSTIAILFVIIVFFLHAIPELQRLSLGWTALLGAILLLILADREDMEAVLARVEWSTLLFFAALFILMEALAKLGLIDWIGKQTEAVILSVSEESRLTVAILIILWVSAIASAFVDNIPLTTMMIRIVTSLGNKPELGLPLQPLVWALAFGACLGGNGTLIGASANVVCAGVAEQHGYRFTFMQYFKVGFPLMVGSVTVITGYLLVCHVLLQWH